MATRNTRPMGSIGTNFGLDGDSRIGQPGFGVISESDLDESGLTGVNKGVGTVPLSPITGPTAKGIPSLTEADLGQTRRPFDSTMTGIPKQDLPFTGTIRGVPAKVINQFPQPIVEGLTDIDGHNDSFGNNTLLGGLLARQTETVNAVDAVIAMEAGLEPIIELTKPKTLEVLTEASGTNDLPAQLQAAMLRISELEEDNRVAQKRISEQLITILKSTKNLEAEKETSKLLREDIANLQNLSLENQQKFENEIDKLNRRIEELLEEPRKVNENTDKKATTLPEPLQKGPNDLVRVSKLPRPVQWLVRRFI